MKGHSAAPGKDFSAFLTGGDLGPKEREHCRDAQLLLDCNAVICHRMLVSTSGCKHL